MNWQAAVTSLVVTACAVYAVWTLMPAAWRRRCRAAAFGTEAAAVDAGGCGGCGGCEAAAAKAPGAPREAVIHVVRRPPAG
jgi:hypothetical protein